MTKTLKSIAPLQLGKILAIIYGLFSLIMLPIFGLFAILGSLAPDSQGAGGGAGVAIGLALVFCLIMPFFYAIIGFLTGLVGGWIYNVVASWVGGIRVEVE